MDTRAKTVQQANQSSNKQVLLVGSSHDCQIVIRDIASSPHHMTITRINKEQYQIEDIGSKDGTYVKGQKITSQVVNRQDIIQIGSRPVEIRWLVSHFSLEVPRSNWRHLPVHHCWLALVQMLISFFPIQIYLPSMRELMVEQSGNVLIADKGSARGTFLNGIQVHSRMQLTVSDNLYLGRFVSRNICWKIGWRS